MPHGGNRSTHTSVKKVISATLPRPPERKLLESSLPDETGDTKSFVYSQLTTCHVFDQGKRIASLEGCRRGGSGALRSICRPFTTRTTPHASHALHRRSHSQRRNASEGSELKRDAALEVVVAKVPARRREAAGGREKQRCRGRLLCYSRAPALHAGSPSQGLLQSAEERTSPNRF